MNTPKVLTRDCWWCGMRLTSSYAEAYDHDGNKVRVHKGCANQAERENHPITAQERQRK